MPFIRVIRDKRGYETTYLLHWYREGDRQRSRILYVFRTPGGVRVGRDPLSPEVQRQIEARHPDIAFDWAVVRDNQQIIETATEPRRRRPRREDGDAAPATPAARAPAAAAPVPAGTPDVKAPASPSPRPPIPSTIQGVTPDEQMEFLAHWYPLIRERISLRIGDPIRREALFAVTERLNPATWTDADQITTGLQAASEALDRLSHVFAKRRRRPRKRPSASAAPGSPPGTASVEAPPSSDGSPPDETPTSER